MAVAVIALVAAATGGGYAAGGLVTSSSIRNGTIQLNDLSPALQKQVRAPGIRGPQGPIGPQGIAGAPGIAAVQVTTAVSDNTAGSGSRNAVATCPAGKQLIGGGGAVEGATGPTMTISQPTTHGRWRATGYASTNFGAWQVTAYAVCAITQ
ncbi:MAG: hypothetical protein AB7O78_07355 [Thermoleophilia bacterium]